MKYLALGFLSIAMLRASAQDAQNLAANETGNLRLIIGIVIAVVVVIAIYLLLRKEDK